MFSPTPSVFALAEKPDLFMGLDTKDREVVDALTAEFNFSGEVRCGDEVLDAKKTISWGEVFIVFVCWFVHVLVHIASNFLINVLLNSTLLRFFCGWEAGVELDLLTLAADSSWVLVGRGC